MLTTFAVKKVGRNKKQPQVKTRGSVGQLINRNVSGRGSWPDRKKEARQLLQLTIGSFVIRS